ncbi:hypothetical protein QA612_05390 [Evansella sp. AB-P1]|uniref:hypothetical protein n=1 Tax=Evansella sp. AB-P1 TaxID=3037653 RepID=UPI00241DA774|nr:hypothetical protein [Evansella sp. AB-P1]MDG5786917.1 hypothetical protein [Evansella sp. AB-P1]
MQARRKCPAFLQRVEKRFAGTEEVSSVPAKSEKEVCGNRGSIQRACKEWKRDLQARRKCPAFQQRVKKRFAGTEEVSIVPAKSEKEVCGNRGSIQRSCKEWKRDLGAQRKYPAFQQKVQRISGKLLSYSNS